MIDKFVRYFFTAGLAALVDIGGFALLTAGEVPVLAAATFSFVVAAVVNYLLSSRFVFGSQATARRFVLFFVAALVGLAIKSASHTSRRYTGDLCRYWPKPSVSAPRFWRTLRLTPPSCSDGKAATG